MSNKGIIEGKLKGALKKKAEIITLKNIKRNINKDS